jgi:hypothetical protein
VGRRTSRTFDYKPKLAAMHGQPMPGSFTQGQQIAQLQGKELRCQGPQFEFQRFGRSGQEILLAVPRRIGYAADDLCIIRSMYTEQINRDPAHTFMNTGSIIAGRPSMGSWLLYGLGSETEELQGSSRSYVLRQGRTNAAGRRPPMAQRISSGPPARRQISVAR